MANPQNAPHGIDKDVWGPVQQQVSDELISACTFCMQSLDIQQSALDAGAATASSEFRGYFSQLFQQNLRIERADQSALVDALDAVKRGIAEAQVRAKEEQARIERARRWQKDHDEWEEAAEQGGVGEWWFKAWNSEPEIDTKDLVAGAAPHISFVPPSPTPHDVPAPGTVAGSMTTSSAVPDDLDVFVSSANTVHDALESPISLLRQCYSQFEETWTWKQGAVAIEGMDCLIHALSEFNMANTADATWIGLISSAFRRISGGAHSVTMSDQAIVAILKSAHAQVYRSNVDIPELALVGMNPTTGYADDPVSTVTGNFIEPEVDLVFGEAASSLRVARMYNSFIAKRQREGTLGVGVFGRGWSSSLDQHLVRDGETLRWIGEDGREITFPLEDGGAARSLRENFWVSRVDDAQTRGWLVSNNQGEKWLFDDEGRWTGYSGGPGTALTVERGASGSVNAINHERGRRFEIDYIGGLVDVVRAEDGRRVEYEYDEHQNLTGVRTECGTRRYKIGEGGLLSSVVSAAGVVEVENSYDDAARVTTQVSRYGRTSRYSYINNSVTVVSDLDGKRSNVWINDDSGRTVGVVDANGGRQSMVYDRRGNLIMVTERDGQSTVHVYDERGNRIKTILPTGGEVEFHYDEYDRLVRAATAEGAETSFEYTDGEERNPARIIDPVGGETKLEWQAGLLVSSTDPTGVRVAFTHNSFGDLTGITNADGHTFTMVRDHAGRLLKAVTPLGNATAFTYDERGVLASLRDASGAVWRYEYDDSGRIVAATDPMGATTRMEYGAQGEVVRTVDPLGRVIERDFDDVGNVSSATLPDGATTRFAYDNLSRLISFTDGAGNSWATSWDINGLPTSASDPTGRHIDLQRTLTRITVTAGDGDLSVTEFDPFGRPVQMTDPSNGADIIAYDKTGRPVEMIDADGGLTLLHRDLAGRVIEQVSPEGRATTFNYDTCGRIAEIVDPLGNTTRIEYDADSRMVRRIDGAGEAASFDYDPLGRVVKAVVPGHGVSTWRYDKAGRVKSMRDPLRGERTFSYDAAGQIVAVTNGLGGVTRYEYDLRGRAVRIVDPAGGVITREFNALDKVTSYTDQLGRTTTATYDAAGRQLTQTDPDGREVSFTYDAQGTRNGIYANGRLLTSYEHDSASRTLTVDDNTAAGAPTQHVLRYDRSGRLASVSTDGRSKGAWTYDRDGLRTSYTSANGETTSYVWDAAGRLSSLRHPSLGAASFTYDGAGRLTGEDDTRVRHAWEFADGFVVAHSIATESGKEEDTRVARDAFGRVLAVSSAEGKIEYSYDDAGELIRLVAPGLQRAWVYDKLGRLVETVEETEDGVSQKKLSYDAASQLVTVETDDHTTRYTYDGSGRRIEKHDDTGERTIYTWDERSHLSSVRSIGADGEGRFLGTHVNGLNMISRVGDTDLEWDLAAPYGVLSEVAGTSVLSLPSGHFLGERGASAPSSAWRQQGSANSADPFDPSGDVAGPGVSFPSGLTIARYGQIEVAGLTWMGARLYDPSTATFLTPDPLPAPAGTVWDANTYNLAGNNPLSLSDPLGLAPITDADMSALTQYNANRHTSYASRVLSPEFLAGAAIAVVGGVLIASGVGGPLGAMLVAGGSDMAMQKLTTGKVDVGEVAVSTVLGAFGGFGAGTAASKLGLQGLKSTVFQGAYTSGVQGFAMGNYHFFTGPGPHTVSSYAQVVGGETLSSAAFGGGTAGLGHHLHAEAVTVHGKLMDMQTVRPEADTVVMGRDMHDRIIPFANKYGFGYYEGTPARLYNIVGNESWIGRHVNMQYNRSWIKYQMRQGKTIIDRGQPHGMPDSDFYDMEKRLVAEYPRHFSVPDETLLCRP